MATPKPRDIAFMGLRGVHSYLGETWLEAEEAAYPAGGFTRRAYVRFEDGKLRVVKISIPDTYFTIPARATIKRITYSGYVSVAKTPFAEAEYIFTFSKR